MEYLITFFNVTTIGLCTVCKIPQILAIAKSKSVQGVSITSVMVELFGYSIVLGYNIVKGYRYAAFMEYFFLVSQDILLLILIFHFLGTLDVVKLGYVGAFVTFFYGFTLGIPHPSILPFLINFVTPISASSKVIALKEIWKTKNSESVSVATWLIAAYTCVSRIFTTLVETGDVTLLITYTIGLILNAAIIASALYFRSPKKSQTPQKKRTRIELQRMPQVSPNTPNRERLEQRLAQKEE